MHPIDIIGIGQGPEDLTPKHMALIKQCDILVGGKRHLEMFNPSDKQVIPITGNIRQVVESIKEKMPQYKIVVLASGDPLFYGIASTLMEHFDRTQLNIHSNISSIAAAFAAIKEPWHDAKIISLHGKRPDSFSFSGLFAEDKVAFLTDPHMNPQYIAAGLIKEGVYDFRFCVLEKLGHRDEEKITWFDNIDLIGENIFAQPNIVILMKRLRGKSSFSRETHIGMEDSLFKHSKGLITKSEIRSITLSKLKLIKKDHILWDIGSGSGSIGIEASFLIPWGHVYAIEKHPGRIADIVHNIKNFNCSNVKVLNSAFPKGINDLKVPDRIFIGGGGESLLPIIQTACNKLAPYGVIVINTVLLQNIGTALTLLEDRGFNPEVVQVQVSRSKRMPFGDRLEPLNPIWIISGSKP